MADSSPLGTAASSGIEDHLREEARRTLEAYRVQPNLVREHVGIEEEVRSGGYGHRQIHELVQNAADAISEAGILGRVHLVLTRDALYCANEGSPIDIDGVNAILNSHMSRKRGAQIGQFGLGFKSVLALSTCPEFYCRSGSFGFDASWSAERIREVLPAVEQTPVLRLARVLDRAGTADDRELTELLQWATTVVKLPRDISDTDWLSEDLEAFPCEFLLFAPHVRQLILDDRVADRVRRVSTRQQGSKVAISEAEEEAEWTVFTKEVSIRDLGRAAQADADRKTRERTVLPLLWAVPHDGRRSRGAFWAFFPTETETTLTGILNAPWKTNADRQNLLDGPFNRALLGEAVLLVTDSLHALLRRDDPGYVLDLLPARAADAAGWADKALIEALEPALGTVECVPNTVGKLMRPGVLGMRPEEALSSAVTDLLVPTPGELPDAWVHPTVEKRERRAKAERVGVKKPDAKAWLESLAELATPASSVRAILVAGVVQKEMNSWQIDSLRNATIILTAAGVLVNAKLPNLFLPGPQEPADTAGPVVHWDVASVPEVRDVLLGLKVPEQSAIAHLDTALSSYPVDWAQVWGHLRRVSLADAVAILSKHGALNPLHAKTLAGDFKPLGKVLLTGKIVPSSGERDAVVGVDPVFHQPDGTLLRALGASDVPVPDRDERSAGWFSEYLRVARSQFYADLAPGSSRPTDSYLLFGQQGTLGPLDPLAALTEEGRVLMTQALLPYLQDEPWVLRHVSRPGAYPSMEFTPPVEWMLRRHGRLSTSLGTKPIAKAVGAFFVSWDSILPVARVDAQAGAAPLLPNTWDELNEGQWTSGLAEIERVPDELLVGRFYGEAVRHVKAPLVVWCQRGDARVALPPTGVHIATDPDTANAHREAGVPSVTVPDRATQQMLVERWGMQNAAGSVRYVAASDESPLADTLPGLRRYVPEDKWSMPMRPCEELWFESAGSGSAPVPLRFARVGSQLCFLASMATLDLLRRVAAEFGMNLSADQLQDALDYARREGRQHLVETVRGINGLAEKLAALVSAAALLDGLPAGVQGLLTGKHESHLQIAHTALAIHGVEVLHHYTGALAAAGVEPPARWSGSPRALEFVDELGFPAEYGGFQRTRRDPAMDVDGPIDLKPLHEFQAQIGTRIQEFLRKPTPERGLLSLPTGSGKTRVVVQAVVESIRRGEFGGSVIWVAQSDELCEQAVQSWAQVWRVFGPGRRLRVSRLWGPTNNRVVEADAPHVVVATYQSLVSRLAWPAYNWLITAACIIIDEAHGSISPSYTEILEAFGVTSRQTTRPLIGLTATPFRSAADPAETQWLVNRYGQQRFDHGVIPGDDPYPVLQAMGVLARVDQQVLPGSELTLTPNELAELVQFNRLPASAELRLGEMMPRNRRIVESIKALPGDWPVLLFATSVEQANLMAALLSLEGVSAKAISGETDHGARRHYIEEFRRGRIRVLSNYNVLATGFDAPSLRALYIARPVYSPVLYQQMLGRGLRGPLNGGKERCLVVNVEDNIAQFGEQLAFRHFEYLWMSEPHSP